MLASKFRKMGGNYRFITDMIDYELKDNLILKYPYTSKDGEPLKYEEDGTYTDVEGEGTILENKTGYEWAHSFSYIINSLLSAGFLVFIKSKKTKLKFIITFLTYFLRCEQHQVQHIALDNQKS